MRTTTMATTCKEARLAKIAGVDVVRVAGVDVEPGPRERWHQLARGSLAKTSLSV